jgi:S-layer protein
MAFPPSQPIDFVEEDYIGFYNRAGDAPGANFWVNQLNTSNTTLGVAVGFAVSSESTAIYPYLAAPNVLDPGTYITQIYTNVLGRAPDGAGQTFWTNRLAALNTYYTGPNNTVVNLPAGTKLPNASVDPKVVAAAEVLTEMLQSVNMQSGTADAALMANRITVAEDYTTRTGNANVPYSQASSHAVILATNGTPASVTTAEAVTTAYILTAPPPNTFTLTTGLDTFSGNANFVAADIAGAQTWTAGDALTGTGNNNVFTLTSGTAITGNPAGSTVTGIQTATIVDGAGVGTTSALNTTGWTGLTALNITTPGRVNVNAAATTAITVNDSNISGTNVAVNGGSTVTVTDTTAGGGSVTIGATTAAAGAVSVTHTIAGTGNASAGTISVTGGTTVTVNEILTQATGGSTTTGSAVNVTGNASTTAVTVAQTAPVANTAASTANSTVTFANGVIAGGTPLGLLTGQSVTVAGLTFTATSDLTANQVAAAFANLANNAVTGSGVANGNYSGTFTGWSTGASSGSSVTLTSASANTTVSAPVVSALNANGAPFVTVNGAGFAGNVTAIADGAVNIADANAGSPTAAATITTVNLSGYGTSTISSNALNSLTLTGSAATVTTTEGLTVPTNTTLALTVSGVTGNVIDSSNQFVTINITTGAVASKFNIVDTALTTVSIGGTGNLQQDYSGNALLTSITDTTTGTSTLTLNPGQGFVGTGSGIDKITLNATTTATITGGSAANVLTLGPAFAGTQDMTKITNFGSIATANTGTLGVSNVVAGTALALTGNGVTFGYATSDNTGASDSLAVTIGSSATGAQLAGTTVNSLSAVDKLGVGIGSVSIASSYNEPGNTTTISNLDSGLGAAGTGGISSLTLSGNAAFVIGNWGDAAANVSIINNSTSVQNEVIFLNDNFLTQLTVGGSVTPGSGANTFLALSDTLANTLTINDTGAGVLQIVGAGPFENNLSATSLVINDTSSANLALGNVFGITDNALTSFNLSNTGGALFTATGITSSALVGTSTLTGAIAATIVSSSGSAITIAGGTDNAAVNLTLSGGGNDAVTLGAGADAVSLGNGLNTVSYAAHATADSTTVAAGGQTSAANLALHFTTITGALGGTVADTVTTATGAGTNVITPISANTDGSLTAFITNHAGAAGNYVETIGTTTYVFEHTTAAITGTDTVIGLTGVHTVSVNAAVFTLLT